MPATFKLSRSTPISDSNDATDIIWHCMACHYPRKLWLGVSCCYIEFTVLKGLIVLLFSTRLGLFDICLFFPEDLCKRKLDNLIWTSQVISPPIMESWFWFPSAYCWSLQSSRIRNKQHPTPYLLSRSASSCVPTLVFFIKNCCQLVKYMPIHMCVCVSFIEIKLLFFNFWGHSHSCVSVKKQACSIKRNNGYPVSWRTLVRTDSFPALACG